MDLLCKLLWCIEWRTLISLNIQFPVEWIHRIVSKNCSFFSVRESVRTLNATLLIFLSRNDKCAFISYHRHYLLDYQQSNKPIPHAWEKNGWKKLSSFIIFTAIFCAVVCKSIKRQLNLRRKLLCIYSPLHCSSPKKKTANKKKCVTHQFSANSFSLLFIKCSLGGYFMRNEKWFAKQIWNTIHS